MHTCSTSLNMLTYPIPNMRCFLLVLCLLEQFQKWYYQFSSNSANNKYLGRNPDIVKYFPSEKSYFLNKWILIKCNKNKYMLQNY